MGGWKQSGIGYRHGEPGIKKYCRTESLVITRFGGKREPTWYPYTKGRRGLSPHLPAFRRAGDWSSGAWDLRRSKTSALRCRGTGHPPPKTVAQPIVRR